MPSPRPAATIRSAGVLVALLLLSACQVTGTAAPAGQTKDGIVGIGAPGSGAP